jgi:hypothetical protein
VAKNGFKAIDSDLHVLEPADLWERYIDPRFKDRAPRGLTDVRRGLGVVVEGQVIGHAAEGIGRQRRDYASGLQHEHYAEAEARNYDGIGLLGAMDREGLDIAVLYPSRGLLVVSVPGLDRGLFGAISRAYNDWLHDLCQADPARLFGAAMVPAPDVEASVAEARRVREEYQFKAIFLSADVYDGRGWDNPVYYPLWEECQRQALFDRVFATQPISWSLNPGLAQGLGLRFAARFGQGGGEVREQHREEQPHVQRYEIADGYLAHGFSDRGLNHEQESEKGPHLHYEHHRVLPLDIRPQHHKRLL